MASRRSLVFVCLSAFLSMGASHRTTNFVANGPTPQIAQQIGEAAEQYRREKALVWLGTRCPPGRQPCPLTAKVTMSGAGGATSFAFDRGRILGQQMNIEGSFERLLSSVLPHEVTHTVFAHHFRTPGAALGRRGRRGPLGRRHRAKSPRHALPANPEHAGASHAPSPPVRLARISART